MSLVAEELGYQSQSAFSAMFRRAFGQSPRAFIARDIAHREDNGTTLATPDELLSSDVEADTAPPVRT